MPPSAAAPVPPVLTSGEWSALIYIVPDQARHLVLKLAVHHGAIPPPVPEQCPVCGKGQGEPEQGELHLSRSQ
jgi:hypothetical protein